MENDKWGRKKVSTHDSSHNANMQLEVFRFESEEEQLFNDITTADINGEIWFVAADICDSLGLSNPTEALKSLDDDEKLTSVILRSGQNRNVNLVNESGLYALIFKSRKKTAGKFRKWITKEVIPSIRTKGYYGKIDRTAVPNFYLRYKDNYHKIGRGWFSVISELFVTLGTELSKYGYDIPDKGIDGKGLYPDISVGITFSNYLKRMNHPLKDKYETYKHTFPDDRREVDARKYSIDLLPAFRSFVFEEWVPNYANNYFKKKDPEALKHLPKMLEK